MSFYKPGDLHIGKIYKLTEFIERQKIASAYVKLATIDYLPKDQYPIIGFGNPFYDIGARISSQRCRPEILLKEAHAQFGSPTWRRVFKDGDKYQIYAPIGTATWNLSHVDIEDAPEDWRYKPIKN